MTMLEQVLAANEQFIHSLPQAYCECHTNEEGCPCGAGEVSKYPNRQLAIFTCMDTRLVDFLEPALGIERGQAKVIKTAGNTVTGPFGAVVRSLLIAIYELGVQEIMVIGHEDCGMAHSTSQDLKTKMIARGVHPSAIKMIEGDLEHWVDQFHNPVENVKQTVAAIRSNPLVPVDVPIHGLLFDPKTGKVAVLVDGYEEISK